MQCTIIVAASTILVWMMVVEALPQGFYPNYGQLVHQIVPMGKPWPANAEDYEQFSQTTKYSDYVQAWATTRYTTTTTTVRPVNMHWARPIIVFHHERIRAPTTTSTTTTPSTTTRRLTTTTTTTTTTPPPTTTTPPPTTRSTTTTTTTPPPSTTLLAPQPQHLSGFDLLKMQDESNLQLFTSAPPRKVKPADLEPPRSENNPSVANLLPPMPITSMEVADLPVVV